MKKPILKLIMIITFFAGITVLQSCESDCEKYCDNGYCDLGDCECDYGYSGRYCDVYTGGSSSSSSSSSSSNSGGQSTGQVTFYTSSDLGCGSIYVTVSGYTTKSISNYYSGGITSCGASGCATYTLYPGTYYYSAYCSGYTWSSTSFTITSNGCLKYELY